MESDYGNGQKAGNSYDSLNRVISRSFDGTQTYKYSYDASGNLALTEDIVNGTNHRYIYMIMPIGLQKFRILTGINTAMAMT